MLYPAELQALNGRGRGQSYRRRRRASTRGSVFPRTRHELLLRCGPRTAQALEDTIGSEFPCPGFDQLRVEHRAKHRPRLRIVHLGHDFYPPPQVTRTPVRRPDVVLTLTGIFEVDNA